MCPFSSTSSATAYIVSHRAFYSLISWALKRVNHHVFSMIRHLVLETHDKVRIVVTGNVRIELTYIRRVLPSVWRSFLNGIHKYQSFLRALGTWVVWKTRQKIVLMEISENSFRLPKRLQSKFWLPTLSGGIWGFTFAAVDQSCRS